MTSAQDCLTSSEKDLLRKLKRLGIVVMLDDKRVWTKNGGVKCTCGDGHKDIFRFHADKIHPHTNLQMAAGGPLSYDMDFLRKKFSGFGRKKLEIIRRAYVEDLKTFMRLKRTRTLFHVVHYPCGAAKDARISFLDIMTVYLPSIIDHFDALCRNDPEFFRQERIYYKLHVKKINGGGKIEQNTYTVSRQALMSNIDCLRQSHF